MHPPSERAGQKADPAARRGGLAARADLPSPQATSENRNGEPFCNPLDPSRKNRAARICRAAPENPAALAANPDLSAVGCAPHRVSNRGNLSPRLRVEFFGLWEIWAKIPRNRKWSAWLDVARNYFQK